MRPSTCAPLSKRFEIIYCERHLSDTYQDEEKRQRKRYAFVSNVSFERNQRTEILTFLGC